jgi:hypothetical protein
MILASGSTSARLIQFACYGCVSRDRRSAQSDNSLLTGEYAVLPAPPYFNTEWEKLNV